MKYITENLAPSEIFRYFEDISRIPRGSGNESHIADYLEAFAENHGFFCVRDGSNNVFIRKEPSTGYGDRPAVLLQGHTDMVCEQNTGTNHDFLKEGISLVLDGDVLHADGTTLGGDDGVAVAIMLALLDSSSAEHPMLECLFTSGEEIGLLGMDAFDESNIKARMMINLDSAGEGVATVSCAGGVRTDFVFESDDFSEVSGEMIEVKLSGFAGGHSGENINDGRVSANKLLARLLAVAKSVSPINIASISGGNKDNAIPREAECRFFSASPDLAIDSMKKTFELVMRSEITEADCAGAISIKKTAYNCKAMSSLDSARLVSLLLALPYGVIAMSHDIPNFVETSSNIGIITTLDGKVEITSSSRSSIDSKLDFVMSSLDELGSLAGARVSHHSRYPGWAAASKSLLAEIYADVYEDLFGERGKTMGIHAGLECGILKSRLPDMDIISIGPMLDDIHTPDEKLSVSSFARLYETVKEILRRVK